MNGQKHLSKTITTVFFYFHFQFFKHVAESAKIENLSKNKHKNTHTHTQVRAHVFLDSAQVEFNTKVKRK